MLKASNRKTFYVPTLYTSTVIARQGREVAERRLQLRYARIAERERRAVVRGGLDVRVQPSRAISCQAAASFGPARGILPTQSGGAVRASFCKDLAQSAIWSAFSTMVATAREKGTTKTSSRSVLPCAIPTQPRKAQALAGLNSTIQS
jgi:hypothetical protein